MFDIFDFESRKISKNVEQRNPYTDEFYNERLEELKERVDEKRYVHTLGVVEMSQKLCEAYDVDYKKARLAAVLHDWDKCYTDKEMKERIYVVGADALLPKEVIDKMPKLLHGATAAFALGYEFPNIPSDVLRAVINHTTASTHMSDLDMVIYIADALDPNRKYPEYEELVEQIGKVSLEDLFVKTFSKATIAVLNKGKALHPKTGEIWNHYIEAYNKRHKKKKKS